MPTTARVRTSMADSSKKVVVMRPDGIAQIVGTADAQPPDLIQHEGTTYNLIGLRRYKYYVYTPIMSPSETMQRFHESQQ